MCNQCDNNNDGIDDVCFQCNHNSTPGNEDCWKCDNNGDGRLDACRTCNEDGDPNNVPDGCKNCDPNKTGTATCPTCDKNDDTVDETCYDCKSNTTDPNQPYDECSKKLKNKQDLIDCPVLSQSTTPMYNNGCTAGFLEGWIGVGDKDNPCGLEDTAFTNACITHDHGYETCTPPGNWVTAKAQVDDQFLADMEAVCAAAGDPAICGFVGPVGVPCEAAAIAYHAAVSAGDGPWEETQLEFCACCF